MVLKKGDFVKIKNYKLSIFKGVLRREGIYNGFNIYEIVNIRPSLGLGPKYDIKCLDSNRISNGWSEDHFKKIKVNDKTLKILFGTCNE